jgi:transcriptional regulator with XRE-family HTH domain
MKINSQFVIALRKKKSWSQEELATASGLNLRTIQRIESDGVASLQSSKALAAAFDVEVGVLDTQEKAVMKTYEYKTITFKLQGLMRKYPDMASVLTREGEQGWRLRELVVPDANGGMGNPWALLEREIVK